MYEIITKSTKKNSKSKQRNKSKSRSKSKEKEVINDLYNKCTLCKKQL